MLTAMEAMSISPTIAAYMSGILDGEGCIYVNRRKPSGRRLTPGYGVKVVVNITSKAIVDWFRENVELTSIHGHQPEGNRQYKYLCTWNNSAAERLLLACRPYMVIKAAQADLGLALLKDLRENRGGVGQAVSDELVAWREEIKARISALNRRGRPEVDDEPL